MNRISFYHASKTFSNILKKNYISFKSSFLADLFLYSYESEFLQKLVKDKRILEARAFNFTYRYIDDILSINNSRFAEFLPLIYPPELEIKEKKLCPHHFWTYTSNLTTVVNSVLKFMISETTSILKS